MIKSRLARVLDNLVIAIAIFLFAFVFARFYAEETYIALIVSIIATLGVLMPLNIRSNKRRIKEFDNILARLTTEYFLFLDEHACLEYFFNAFEKKYEEVIKEKNYLRIKNSIVYPNLTESLSIKRLVRIYNEAKRATAKTLIVLIGEQDKNLELAKTRLTGLRLEIFKSDKVYKLLKSLDSLPKLDTKVNRKEKLKGFLANALDKRRTKSYLFVFFTLIIGAAFFNFGLYFLLMSGVSLSLAILSRTGVSEYFHKD
ncbi:MAG: hypothetical protein FWE03_04415 [Firmicutes bacterium]|nr:hypothetical protein [Bacillota bacterium]